MKETECRPPFTFHSLAAHIRVFYYSTRTENARHYTIWETPRESLKIALPCHALGSHGWLQVRLGGLHCRMRSADSAEKDHGSCEKGLREAMGEMSPVQERDNL